MNTNTTSDAEGLGAALAQAMPTQLALYYGGSWHDPAGGYQPTVNSGIGCCHSTPMQHGTMPTWP